MSAEGWIAALPMYDFPTTAGALDAVWSSMAAHVRAAGFAAPERLTRDLSPDETWRHPKLMFGQTCGYPLMTALREQVAVLAAPAYAFDGCEGFSHCSFIVARADDARENLADFRGARALVNAFDSDTGMNLFRAAVAPLAEGRAFFASVAVTGAHRASLERIARGEGDLAAIDCVSFALIAAQDGGLAAQVKAIARTRPSPNLPFIMAGDAPAGLGAAIGAALRAAMDAPDLADARAVLGWGGLRAAAFADYEAVLEHERLAHALGYRSLA